MLAFFTQGIIVSVPLTYFLETAAAGWVASLGLGVWGYVALVTVLAPFIEEFTKVFPLTFRHAETPRSIIRLGFLSGFGFGMAEFLLYILVLGAPVAIRLPEMFFHGASTAIAAYGVASSRFGRFYLLAVFLHFSNNFLTFFGDIWFIFGTAVIAVCYVLAYRYYVISPDTYLE